MWPSISKFHRRLPNCFSAARASRCNERGSALLELAIVVPVIFLPLMLAAVDLGVIASDSIQISSAAHAGALYGMQGTCCVLQTSLMQTAAQNEAPSFGTNLIVTPTSYYACSASQASPTWANAQNVIDSTSLAAARATCTGVNGHVLAFVKVTTSAAAPMPFHCCGIAATITLSGKSVMEVEELP